METENVQSCMPDTYIARRFFDDKEEDLRARIESDPENISLRLQSVGYMLIQGSTQEAIRECEHAISTLEADLVVMANPVKPEKLSLAHYLLGCAYYLEGSSVSARSEWEEVIDICQISIRIKTAAQEMLRKV
jgi:DNA-binding SARP family transcriptional activator